MKPFQRHLIVSAGLLGFTGVAMGAFGAHGLRHIVDSVSRMENWKTAVFYQLIHAIALLALAQWETPTISRIGACWIGGVLLFSGSLYGLALGAPARLLWPLTPLGGLVLLCGWLMLVRAGLRQKTP